MKRSTDRIRTTHTGSLPRPADMLEALHARFEGGRVDEAAYEKALARNVREIVRKQVEAGIDIVSDGECSKPSFMAYRRRALGGFEPRMPEGRRAACAGPMDPDGRDATDVSRLLPTTCWSTARSPTRSASRRACAWRRSSTSARSSCERDIANLKAAMAGAGAEEGFMPSRRPIPCDANEHYKTRRRVLRGVRRGDARGVQGDPRRGLAACRSTIRGW